MFADNKSGLNWGEKVAVQTNEKGDLGHSGGKNLADAGWTVFEALLQFFFFLTVRTKTSVWRVKASGEGENTFLQCIGPLPWRQILILGLTWSF